MLKVMRACRAFPSRAAGYKAQLWQEAPPNRNSDEARYQVTATRGAVAMSSDRNTIIRHRRVAFLDEVWRHVRMLGTRHAIAFACDVAAVEAHCAGPRFDLAAVIGGVTDADEIHHFVSSLAADCRGTTPGPLPRSRLLLTQPRTGVVFFEF